MMVCCFKRKLRLWLGLGVFLGLCPWQVFAISTETRKIQKLLQGYEWQLHPAAFTRLGQNTDSTLIDLINTAEPIPDFYRHRALIALRLFPKERVAHFLENYLSRSTSYAGISRALSSFAAGFAQAQPERVLAATETLLENSNAHIRIAATIILKTIPSPKAEARYRQRLQGDISSWERQASLKPADSPMKLYRGLLKK